MVCGEGFAKPARSYATAYGLPTLRLLTVDNLIAHQGPEELRRSATDRFDALIREVTRSGESGGTPAAARGPEDECLYAEDDYLALNRRFLEAGWTDGLPIIPPARALATEMLP